MTSQPTQRVVVSMHYDYDEAHVIGVFSSEAAHDEWYEREKARAKKQHRARPERGDLENWVIDAPDPEAR